MTARESIVARAKELEIDSYYSSKGHYKASSRWDHLGLALGLVSVVASVIAGITAQTTHTWWTTGLSFAVSGTTAVLTFTKASERASLHRNAGVKYGNLRDRLKCFYTIDLVTLHEEKLLKQSLEKFVAEKFKVSQESPHIPLWAYKLAEKERSKESFMDSQP